RGQGNRGVVLNQLPVDPQRARLPARQGEAVGAVRGDVEEARPAGGHVGRVQGQPQQGGKIHLRVGEIGGEIQRASQRLREAGGDRVEADGQRRGGRRAEQDVIAKRAQRTAGIVVAAQAR